MCFIQNPDLPDLIERHGGAFMGTAGIGIYKAKPTHCFKQTFSILQLDNLSTGYALDVLSPTLISAIDCTNQAGCYLSFSFVHVSVTSHICCTGTSCVINSLSVFASVGLHFDRYTSFLDYSSVIFNVI